MYAGVGPFVSAASAVQAGACHVVAFLYYLQDTCETNTFLASRFFHPPALNQIIALLRELMTAKTIHSKYMDSEVAHNTAQRFNTEVRHELIQPTVVWTITEPWASSQERSFQLHTKRTIL